MQITTTRIEPKSWGIDLQESHPNLPNAIQTHTQLKLNDKSNSQYIGKLINQKLKSTIITAFYTYKSENWISCQFLSNKIQIKP